MPIDHLAVVANPSKLDDPAAERSRLEAQAREAGCERFVWLETTPDDPGIAMTRQALHEGAQLVCALGGDGTVRAVGGVLAGGATPLGLLPAGTGNLLARNLDVPLNDREAALAVALGDVVQAIDVGMVSLDDAEAVPFLVITGAGLDAQMMDSVDGRLKQRIGWLAYALSGVQFVAERGFRARVDGAMGGRWHRLRTVMVCNCGRLQAGVNLVPEAHPADGLLDVLELSPRGALAWLATIRDVITRRRSDHVVHEATERVRIELAKPVIAQLDGDATEPVSTIEAWVEARALHVKLPRTLEPSGTDR